MSELLYRRNLLPTSMLFGLTQATADAIVNAYGQSVYDDVIAFLRNNPTYAQYINEDFRLVNSIVDTGYTRWISNGGNGANIDTGIIRDIANTYRFKGVMSYPNVQTRQLNGAQGFVYFGVTSGGYQIAGSGTSVAISGAVADGIIDFDVTYDCPLNTVSANVNNATYSASNVGYSNTPAYAHLFLFSLNDNVLPSDCKISVWELYVNGTLRRNLVPFVRENVNGMLDLVTFSFVTNALGFTITETANS